MEIPTAQGKGQKGHNMANNHNFKLRDAVINFGTLGFVVEILPDGRLVLDNVRIGRWCADPSLCTMYHLQIGDLV